MQTREPHLRTVHHARVLVHTGGDVLHAADLAADRVGVIAGERRRRAEAGHRIPEPLFRGGMIVHGERIVFGMAREHESWPFVALAPGRESEHGTARAVEARARLVIDHTAADLL